MTTEAATVIEGRIVRLGDNVNTDVILPGPYLNLTDPEELGKHLLETYDPEIAASVAPGDVLVAGTNFGSGSSREQAVLAIKARGVQAVVAAGFARIFLRNAINLGLPVYECPPAAAAARPGERIAIDPKAGVIRVAGQEFTIPAQPRFLADLMAAGGLVEWTRHRLEERRGEEGQDRR